MLAVGAVVLFLETGVVLGVLLPGTTTLVLLGLWSSAAGTAAVLPIAVAAPASAAGALLGWSRGHRRRGLPSTGHGRLRTRVDPVVVLARHAFEELDLHRLQVAIIPRNRASRRVVEKLELRDEGIAVRYLAINGRWEDHIRYALTAEEWAERGESLVEAWIGPPPAPVLRLRQRG